MTGLTLAINPEVGTDGQPHPEAAVQITTLVEALKQAGIETQLKRTPTVGTKGSAAEIILALGSAGVITAAIQIFKAWLSRANDRGIIVKLPGENGEPMTLVLKGTNISEKTLQLALTKAFEKLRPGPG